MTTLANQHQDRLWELLADRATGDLSPQDSAELDELLARAPAVDADSMDRAAAAVYRAIASPAASSIPLAVQRRLSRVADDWIAGHAPESEQDPDRPGLSIAAWMGWLAAAACLALAVAGWWPRVTARTRGGQLATDTQEYLRFQERGDVRHAPWSDFNSLADQSPPEIRGVHGEVAWSESDQSGYLTFADLPINDPKTEQYQLWIIDSRGLNQRVSGGVFNALPSGGKVVVPITPSLPIKGAAAFAVTIEPPGGNAVSDMTRRVVIASLPKS